MNSQTFALLETFASLFGSWAIAYYAATTGVLLIAFVAMRPLRQPAQRVALAWVTCAALALLALAPWMPIDRWFPAYSLTAVSQPAESRAADKPDEVVTPAAEPNAAAVADIKEAPTSPADFAPSALSIPAPPIVLDSWRNLLPSISRSVVGVIAAAGAMGMIGWLSCGAWQARRLRRESIAAPDALRTLLKQVCEPRNMPRLLVSRRIATPLAFGLRRPVIMLPADWIAEDADAGRWAPILRHECAHLRHGDLWLLGLTRWLLPVLFAQPLFWWLRRQIRADQEILADAAACGADPHAYATELVAWARRVLMAPTATPAFGLGVWERCGSLDQRVRWLLAEERIEPRSSRRFRACAALAMAALVLAMTWPAAWFVGFDPRALAQADELRAISEFSAEPPAEAKPTDAQPANDEAKPAPAEPQPDSPLKLDDFKSTVDDGELVLRFKVAVPKGERIRIHYGETPRGDTSGAEFVLESERDEPLAIEISFQNHQQVPGDTNKLPLMELRLQAEGAYPAGLVGVVSKPIQSLPKNDRAMVVTEKETDTNAIGGAKRRLFYVVDRRKVANKLDTVEPRAEMTIAREPREEKKAEPTAQQKLAGHWRRQAVEIGSAQIRYRMLRNVAPDLTRDQMNELLKSVDLVNDREAIRTFAMKISGKTPPAGGPLPPWPVSTYSVVGVKSCERFDVPKDTMVRLNDGEIDLAYSGANHQFDVWQPGRSRAAGTSLNNFRHFMADSPRWELAKSETLPSGEVRFVGDRFDVVADPRTGFVSRFDHWSSVARQDSIFLGPKTYPGKIVFPTVAIHCRYNGDRLGMYEVFVIDEAHFNEPLPEETFVVAGAKGNVVVDYRAGEFRHPARRLEEDVPDMAKYLEQQEVAEPADAPNRSIPAEPTSYRKPADEKAERVEISQDDGTSAGKMSIAGGGHGLRCEAPGDDWSLTSVRIFGARYGYPKAPAEKFHVWLCDKDGTELADFKFPYAKFERGEPSWVTLPIKATNVLKEFILCVGFNPEQTKGVYVHHDAASSGNSLTGLPGETFEPFAKGDWMIRPMLEHKPGEKTAE